MLRTVWKSMYTSSYINVHYILSVSNGVYSYKLYSDRRKAVLHRYATKPRRYQSTRAMKTYRRINPPTSRCIPLQSLPLKNPSNLAPTSRTPNPPVKLPRIHFGSLS